MSRNLRMLLIVIVVSAALLIVQLRAPVCDGAELYLANCSACHGVYGRETRAAHGPTDMPVWGKAFSRTEGYDAAAQQQVDERIAALVNFLGRVQLSPGR